MRINCKAVNFDFPISVNPSKSIANRVLMIKAISGLPIQIKNISDSEDTIVLKNALVAIEENKFEINIGHAGTSFRFLTAYLSTLKNKTFILSGSERMHQRPIKELVEALNQLGAQIEFIEKEGFPPLKIIGQEFQKSECTIKANISSQYISALMLIAPSLKNGLTIHLENEISSEPYLKMTAAIMKLFSADVKFLNSKIIIVPRLYKNNSVKIEGDWSSASYWYNWLILSKEEELKINDLKLNSIQGDSICVNLFEAFGVETKETVQGITLTKVKNFNLPKHFEYNFSNCPDLAQTIITLCAGLNISGHFTGLHSLPIKESNRIEDLKTELSKLGNPINVTANSFAFQKRNSELPDNISFETYNDHRMALCLSTLACLIPEVTITNAEVINKSYPLYWRELKKCGLNFYE